MFEKLSSSFLEVAHERGYGAGVSVAADEFSEVGNEGEHEG